MGTGHQLLPQRRSEVDPGNRLFRTFGDNSEKARYLSVNWDRTDGPQARQTLLTLLPVKGVDKVYHCGGEKLSHWYDDKGVQGE